MSKVYTDPANYTAIAAAIRYKNGSAAEYKPNQMAAAIREISTPVQPLSVTENGTYTAPAGSGYSPITVDVGGSPQPVIIPYTFYRLTITDFRRNGGNSPQTFGSCAEFSVYDENGVNLARLSGCEYSCNTYLDKPASNAYDGNINSFWESNYSGVPSTTNWVQVKLPSSLSVSSFGVTPRNSSGSRDYAYSFTISGSDDGQSWTTIIKKTGLNSGWTYGVERVFPVLEDQEKTLTVTQNGVYTVLPDAGRRLSKVTITVQV